MMGSRMTANILEGGYQLSTRCIRGRWTTWGCWRSERLQHCWTGGQVRCGHCLRHLSLDPPGL